MPNTGKGREHRQRHGKNGTRAIVVVKVRLLAVRPSLSSRKRSPSVNAVDFHGKWVEIGKQLAEHPSAAMMPSPMSTSAFRSPHHPAMPWRSPDGSLQAACWDSSFLAWPGNSGSRPCGRAAPGWLIKVLPLCFPLAGLLRNRMYTYRWVSLMVWIYFTEGVVRA